jgi:hypothetical protein
LHGLFPFLQYLLSVTPSIVVVVVQDVSTESGSLSDDEDPEEVVVVVTEVLVELDDELDVTTSGQADSSEVPVGQIMFPWRFILA